MAAPASVNVKTMNGKFLMNKALSNSSEEILQLQGISWFKRRAIATFSLTLGITHTTNEENIEHITVTQTLSGGIAETVDEVILDGKERSEDDDVFGAVTGTSGRTPVDEVTDEYLKKDWTEDTIKDGLILTNNWSTPEKNPCIWRAVQAWGFEIINGERRYVRRTVFTSSKKKEPIHVRLVYDYLGPV